MPNRIPTPGIPTPQVRTSKAAQPAAKPTVSTAPKPVAKPTVKATPKPNPTQAFDKDYNARFKNGVYDSGDYKNPPAKNKSNG